MSNNSNPVVRMAPSPTGNLHVGTARTALYNFLFARQNNGKFILRIEDTDTERSRKEYEDDILDGLSWLGVTWDEMYRQSERGEIYEDQLKKLLEKDLIFVSKETPTEEGQREEVIRFRNPNKTITFEDEIRGEVTFDTTELGDFVIARSMKEPLYHFAVVVDDFLSGVTHVIRGEDHISNTPRQILIQEALGAPRPIYAHLPLLLGKDRSKLSKRNGTTSLNAYREKGYLKEAMVNFLTLLGFNPGGEKEIFALNELINVFDLKRVQKGGAIFDEEKLRWVNKEHLKNLPTETLNQLILDWVSRVIDLDVIFDKNVLCQTILERVSVLSDIEDMQDELKALVKIDGLNAEELHWKKDTEKKAKKHLEKIEEILAGVDNWQFNVIEEKVMPYAEKEGKGDVLWPMRFALSGRTTSMGPFILASILGKEVTLERIKNAISLL